MRVRVIVRLKVRVKIRLSVRVKVRIWLRVYQFSFLKFQGSKIQIEKSRLKKL